MKALFVILIVFVLSIAALMFIPVYVGAEYVVKNDVKRGYIIIKIFRVIPFKIWLKTDKKKTKKKEKMTLQKYIKTASGSMEAYKESKDLIKEILEGITKKVSFEEVIFDVGFGTGNAASTGIMTGAVWSATDIFVCILDRIFGVRKFSVNVTPYFDKKHFSGQFKGILKLRLVNIMIILSKIKLVINIFKEHINKKEKITTNKEKAVLKNGRTSN
ncbi:MAG: DUF2953 domain-containing protein [Ruminococcaceae bacterium]|nr:DUF2953 domain-containing protein [Oscillospiraceae bacterium]